MYVPATGTTAAIEYRADERFAFCSTFKAPLVAAVLHQNPLTHLDKLITYTSDDIRSISPVAQQHVQTGMTIGQLCDAAIRYSDGTAANLLLADLGGPGGGTAAFTGYLRSLGDTVSRLDAEEPELNRDPPGDERDTTTPHAIALVLQQLVLGNALPPDKRALLTDWMARNTTGAKRIRAGFPADWKVIDKTGTVTTDEQTTSRSCGHRPACPTWWPSCPIVPAAGMTPSPVRRCSPRRRRALPVCLHRLVGPK